MVVAGTAAVLLFAWLGRVAGVPLATPLYVGAGLAALAWMIVLVTVPWNLYFAAPQVVAEMAVSRERAAEIGCGRPLPGSRITVPVGCRGARHSSWLPVVAGLGHGRLRGRAG